MLRQAQAGNFFDKVFPNGLQEAKELPECGPAEFNFLVKSLYGFWTVPTESCFNCEDLEISQLLKLYAFAHRYACHNFQNAIIFRLFNVEYCKDWRDVICRHDLERLVTDIPDGSHMHEFLKDWLIKDMFNMQPETDDIVYEFLEELPEFFLRAALKHMLTCNFSRPPEERMSSMMKVRGEYLLPYED